MFELLDVAFGQMEIYEITRREKNGRTAETKPTTNATYL